MPAGDRLPTSGDTFALEVNGFLAADNGFDGADWWIVGDLTGFGEITVRDQDTDLHGVNGAMAALDTIAKQPIIATLACNTGTASTAEAAYREAATAFTAGPDTELHIWAPDWGHVYYTGRGRGSVPRRINMASGVMFAQCTFMALDPTPVEVAP